MAGRLHRIAVVPMDALLLQTAAVRMGAQCHRMAAVRMDARAAVARTRVRCRLMAEEATPAVQRRPMAAGGRADALRQ